jgi:hypothetical protein
MKTFLMRSERLTYEPLTAAHAHLLAEILTSQAVLAYIDKSTQDNDIEQAKIYWQEYRIHEEL